MDTTDVTFGWQRYGGIGLALMSLMLPAIVIIPRQASSAPITQAVQMNDYRLTVVALVLGLACGVGAVASSRRAGAAGMRWLRLTLASAGILLGAWLLRVLIGSCGAQVLWRACRP